MVVAEDWRVCDFYSTITKIRRGAVTTDEGAATRWRWRRGTVRVYYGSQKRPVARLGAAMRRGAMDGDVAAERQLNVIERLLACAVED